MKLAAHTYGKARVRVLRLVREQTRHRISELSVGHGPVGPVRSRLHPRRQRGCGVVPTDTMKNLVYITACQHPDLETESFAIELAQGMLHRYGHVSEVHIDLVETPWHRLHINGSDHATRFRCKSQACTSVGGGDGGPGPGKPSGAGFETLPS